mmetsp:Transcript_36549/g.103998  ORF Transcript_36549/g.103998 Transcript_36549/m.103998 type:complete len:255 (+) Transcript_36549:238-1002(+)
MLAIGSNSLFWSCSRPLNRIYTCSLNSSSSSMQVRWIWFLQLVLAELRSIVTLLHRVRAARFSTLRASLAASGASRSGTSAAQLLFSSLSLSHSMHTMNYSFHIAGVSHSSLSARVPAGSSPGPRASRARPSGSAEPLRVIQPCAGPSCPAPLRRWWSYTAPARRCHLERWWRCSSGRRARCTPRATRRPSRDPPWRRPPCVAESMVVEPCAPLPCWRSWRRSLSLSSSCSVTLSSSSRQLGSSIPWSQSLHKS